MTPYSENRYTTYENNCLKGDKNNTYVKLLPDEFINVTYKNSFVINALDGRQLNGSHFKNVNIDKILYSVRAIEHNRRNCVFQIVVLSDMVYINPWFVQLHNVLMKDRIRIGFIKPADRNVLVKLNRLLHNVIIEPVSGCVCVLGTYNAGKTKKQTQSELMGNTTIFIDDYIDLILESSIALYFEESDPLREFRSRRA